MAKGVYIRKSMKYIIGERITERALSNSVSFIHTLSLYTSQDQLHLVHIAM